MTTATMERPRAQTDRSNELLSIRLGGQEFAVNIMAIREIRGWVAATHLPQAPSYILGMINLRGTVLVVIDLAQRLGLGEREPNPASVIVVVEANGRVVGLLVDEVCDIITVTDSMRQETPSIEHGASQEFIDGLVMIEERIISVIAINAVVPNEATADEFAVG
jgi:purine-binding chemotaxis protein CheW